MGPLRRCLICVCTFGLLAGAAGCARVFHELQFHRLWRLNRGPGMSTDVYYSIPPEFGDESPNDRLVEPSK